LLEQTAATLEEGGFIRADRQHPTRPLHVLHSRNTKAGVAPALDALYAVLKAQPNRDAAVHITHTALFERPIAPNPELWDLVIDEVPDTVSFLSIDGQVTHWHLTRHLDARPMPDRDLYQLVPKDDDEFYRMGWIRRIAINRPFRFTNSQSSRPLYGRE
jgi:hypothetical protein